MVDTNEFPTQETIDAMDESELRVTVKKMAIIVSLLTDPNSEYSADAGRLWHANHENPDEGDALASG